jgi:hypothetical protein
LTYQLGHRDQNSISKTFKPVYGLDSEQVIQICCCERFVVILCKSGRMYYWGEISGHFFSVATLLHVSSSFVQVSHSRTFVIGITALKQIYCIGEYRHIIAKERVTMVNDFVVEIMLDDGIKPDSVACGSNHLLILTVNQQQLPQQTTPVELLQENQKMNQKLIQLREDYENNLLELAQTKVLLDQKQEQLSELHNEKNIAIDSQSKLIQKVNELMDETKHLKDNQELMINNVSVDTGSIDPGYTKLIKQQITPIKNRKYIELQMNDSLNQSVEITEITEENNSILNHYYFNNNNDEEDYNSASSSKNSSEYDEEEMNGETYDTDDDNNNDDDDVIEEESKDVMNEMENTRDVIFVEEEDDMMNSVPLHRRHASNL